MCLYAIGGIKTAKEDMIVYKVVRRGNISLYQRFKYKPNTLYRLRKKLVIIKHRLNPNPQVDAGFHAYQNKWVRDVFLEEKLVAFTIPKGAKYVVGDNGDIVSTSIRSGSLKAI